MIKKSPPPLLSTAKFVLAVASGGLLLLLAQQPAEVSQALLFLMFCFFLLSSAAVMHLCSRSDPQPKIMGKLIPPIPLLATAKFVLAVASGELLFLLGQHSAEESTALLFLTFCFYLLFSAAVVLLLCSRSDPLWLLLTPKEVMGKTIPPKRLLPTAKFVLAVASGGLLLLLAQHPAEESTTHLFLTFCSYLLSSAAVMLLLRSRSDRLWVLLTPNEVTGKIIPPTPLLPTAKFVLAVASGGLLLLLAQHPAEVSPALLFLLFCVFLISSAAVMLLCSRTHPSPPS